MPELDLSLARLKPYKHQTIGVQRILNQNWLLLADEMGLGKTKMVIDAVHALHVMGVINKVLVVCPASVRPVWYDEVYGEIQKHYWKSVSSKIGLFGPQRDYWETDWGNPTLFWLITNYEYIRAEGDEYPSGKKVDKKNKRRGFAPGPRLTALLPWVDRNTLLVLDESSYIKSSSANQTKACMRLRKRVSRVVLLNGTPVTNSPLDLFSQGNLLHPSILKCEYKTHFMARYATVRGEKERQYAVAWPGVPELRRIFKPHVLRRLKKNCLDLPPKLPPVTMTVRLSDKTWRIYKQMREDMVAELESGDTSVARHAVVKLIRLAQITSGMLGGVDLNEPPRIISQEKRKHFLDWYEIARGNNQNLRMLVWCRFVKEVDELYDALNLLKKPPVLGKIYGGQNQVERNRSIRLLDPRVSVNGPVVVLGTPATGKTGLNLTAASVVVYMSHDYSLLTRMQSEDRVHRPGQTQAVSYYDFVATGPKGQQTIDATVLDALRGKKEIAEWTTRHWVTALKKEAA